MARAKLTDPTFPRNLGTLYQEKTVGRKIGALDQKFGRQVLRRAESKYMPRWTGTTISSSTLQKTSTSGNKTRWICVSINHANDKLYNEKGRYGYTPAVRRGRKPQRPENVNKYEWYSRAYADKRSQRHDDIRKGVYNA